MERVMGRKIKVKEWEERIGGKEDIVIELENERDKKIVLEKEWEIRKR